MNIKLSLSLIAITSALFGCATTPNSSVGVIAQNDKVISDGSHILGLPMTRDFIMNPEGYSNEVDTNYRKALIKVKEDIKSGDRKTPNLPNIKIFSIKPVEDTKPRTVILLKKTDIWKLNEWVTLPNLRHLTNRIKLLD